MDINITCRPETVIFLMFCLYALPVQQFPLSLNCTLKYFAWKCHNVMYGHKSVQFAERAVLYSESGMYMCGV